MKRTSSLTPEGKERRPALGRGYTILSFRGRDGKLFAVFCSVLCVCLFSTEIFFSSQVMTSQRDVRGDADQSLMYATGGQAFPRLLPYLKMARTSNARFDRSANAI